MTGAAFASSQAEHSLEMQLPFLAELFLPGAPNSLHQTNELPECH